MELWGSAEAMLDEKERRSGERSRRAAEKEKRKAGGELSYPAPRVNKKRAKGAGASGGARGASASAPRRAAG